MTILVYSPPFKSKRGIPRVVNRERCGFCQISFDREMVSVCNSCSTKRVYPHERDRTVILEFLLYPLTGGF